MLLKLADPDERYAAVRLHSDLAALEYERSGPDWTLDLGGAPVTRIAPNRAAEPGFTGSVSVARRVW